MGPSACRSAVCWILGVCAVALGLEAGARLLRVVTAAADPRSRSAAFAGVADAAGILAEAAALRVEYAPFRMWRLAPSQSGAHFRVDARGFRGRDPGRHPGGLRIALLGGSQAWGVGASSDAATIAGRLEEALSRRLGRPVGVLNAGQPGYVLRQSRLLLFDALLEEPWDVALIFGGFNDVSAALQNRAVGDVQNAERFRRRFDLRRSLPRAATDLVADAAGRSALLNLLGQGTRRLRKRAAVSPGETALPSDLEALLGEAAETYVRDAAVLASACRARGIRAVFALEPCLAVDKPLGADEQKALARAAAGHPLYVAGLRAGYASLRRSFARSGAYLEFLDASRAFEGVADDLFIDEIHMADRANRLLAEWIATRLALEGSGAP